MRLFVYGDNVDTDVIIPARYLNDSSLDHLARHCMEDIDETFATIVTQGDIIVAGNNFGCGSSREHAPLAIKASGISCVIAKSFARIFFRNAINIGLPIVECRDFVENCNKGDDVSIDLERGMIMNKTQNQTYRFEPYPPFLMTIIDENGLVNKVMKGLNA